MKNCDINMKKILSNIFSYNKGYISGKDNFSSDNELPGISFKDVAGLEEVKEELREISEFLIEPERFKKYGIRMPKGIMFYGPPGTGKTMLARALAGETKAGFIYASGSEFIEKFVGVGASRIRSLFEKAQKKVPCIIFIDEIDAIGVSRNADNNSERDQTLNQFLIELDGFKQREGIVVIAATNRLDMIDSALLRPGRFDRQIYIPNPDLAAREAIFENHLKNKPVSENISIKNLAIKTQGLSGAHIANIANEAALLALRKGSKTIKNDEFNEAIIKTTAGLKHKNFLMNVKEKRRIAFHEAGHALVNFLITDKLPEKVTIIPHGEALGFVFSAEKEEKNIMTKQEIADKITILLSGRAAEEIIFTEITTGAQNDLEKANEMARLMVCEYGMGKFKNRIYKLKDANYLPCEAEKEINKILENCYESAKNKLKENRLTLEVLAEELFKKEDLEVNDLEKILKCEFV